jgi:glycosyltransferase involved in cell wall biosynthesis
VTRTRPLKALVKSPFSQYSGYGMDGLGIIRALHEWGCDVYPQPVWVDVPIPSDLLPLFAKELRGPFDLTINHWDPSHLFITEEARRSTRCAVAWTMWEFAGGPGKTGKGVSGLVPHCENRSSLKRNLKWFDMVLGYDDVSVAALEDYIPRRVHRSALQGGYESRLWQPVPRDWTGPRFQFLMHGALNARKAPWTAIEAFNQLKIEKPVEFDAARLAVHTSVPGDIFPELNQVFIDKGMRFFVQPFSRSEMEQFYASGHCLLAPSRGEGKNLPALEFQTTGGVVAATNFGGHTQWLNGDYAYPLDYTLTPTFPDCPWGAHDAKVSVEHMKDVIWHIFTHREEARAKAQLAQRTIPLMCDWQVVIESLFRRIRDNVERVGPEIYDQAMATRADRKEQDSSKPSPLAGLLS